MITGFTTGVTVLTGAGEDGGITGRVIPARNCQNAAVVRLAPHIALRGVRDLRFLPIIAGPTFPMKRLIKIVLVLSPLILFVWILDITPAESYPRINSTCVALPGTL